MPRKTLVQQQTEIGVRDPFGYANSQVKELETTALKSKAKKKAKEEELQKARKELEMVDVQIASISRRYQELCNHLEDSKKSRSELVRALEMGKHDSIAILDTTKEKINFKNFEMAKLFRSQAMLQLQAERGYDLGLASTFRQTR